MAGIADLITGAISGIVSPITSLMQRRAELAAAQHEADLKAVQAQGDRRAELIKQGLAADATWELESIKAGQNYRGFELYVVSIPAILCFCGKWGAAVVHDGFVALNSCPIWFQSLLVSVFLANYGYRVWRRVQSDT